MASDRGQKPPPVFSEKVIAFADILGFSDMVNGASDADLPGLLGLMKELGAPLDAARFYGVPPMCPCAPRLSDTLDFSITQVSDCIVISAEKSPAGVINLVNYCFGIAVRFLQRQMMVRGAIVIGRIFHQGMTIVGEGYQRAVAGEKAVRAFAKNANAEGGPFIEVGPDVIKYIAEQPDKCVRTMFEGSTHTDGSLVTIYPFHALATSPAAVVGEDFDPQRWIVSVTGSLSRWQGLRADLQRRSAGASNRVQAKFAHSLEGIDHIIARDQDRLRSLKHIIATGRKPPIGSVWGAL